MALNAISSSTADQLFSAIGNQQSQFQALSQAALSRGADRALQKDYDGAATEFRRAISFDPSPDNAVQALDLLATVYLQADKPDEAMKAYQSSIAIDPSNDATHLKLGNIYFSNGSYSEAEKEYKTAVTISPSSSADILSLGQAYLSEGRYQDAEASFQKVTSLDPGHYAGYYAFGQTYYKEGKLDDAVKQFEKVAELKPDFYDVAVDLGSAYADLKMTDQAQEQLDTLNANKPDLAPLLSTYMEQAASPQFSAVYNLTGFNDTLGPGTRLYDLVSSLGTPNGVAQCTMLFSFNKEMDSASIQNPYNWSISRSAATSPEGPYNWGLPVAQTEATISPVPASVVYHPDSRSAEVTFFVSQNADLSATLDPSHLVFKFGGKDVYGNSMDAAADEYNGISKIA